MSDSMRSCASVIRFDALPSKNTIKKVTIVVPVLMISCQVSLKFAAGPSVAQTATTTSAAKKACGLPMAVAMKSEIRSNKESLVATVGPAIHLASLLFGRSFLAPSGRMGAANMSCHRQRHAPGAQRALLRFVRRQLERQAGEERRVEGRRSSAAINQYCDAGDLAAHRPHGDEDVVQAAACRQNVIHNQRTFARRNREPALKRAAPVRRLGEDPSYAQ